jgi:hypothetical protein
MKNEDRDSGNLNKIWRKEYTAELKIRERVKRQKDAQRKANWKYVQSKLMQLAKKIKRDALQALKELQKNEQREKRDVEQRDKSARRAAEQGGSSAKKPKAIMCANPACLRIAEIHDHFTKCIHPKCQIKFCDEEECKDIYHRHILKCRK